LLLPIDIALFEDEAFRVIN
jgi:hypothetical protein